MRATSTYALEGGVPSDDWMEAPNVVSQFEAFCRASGETPPDGVWGDKSPQYRTQLARITRMWPRVRLVHVVRDPRAVCLSTTEAWGKSLARTADRWRCEVELAMSFGRTCPAYLEVRYEDLVCHPVQTATLLTDFLELEFDRTMLRPGATEGLGAAANGSSISGASLDRWRTELADPEVRAIESLCSPLMNELGYRPELGTPTPCRLGALRRASLRLSDSKGLIRHRTRRHGLRRALRITLLG